MLLSGNGTLSAPLRAYNNNIIDSFWKIEEEEHNKGFFCRTSHSSKGRTQKGEPSTTSALNPIYNFILDHYYMEKPKNIEKTFFFQ